MNKKTYQSPEFEVEKFNIPSNAVITTSLDSVRESDSDDNGYDVQRDDWEF